MQVIPCDKATVFSDVIKRTLCKTTEICYCKLMATIYCDGRSGDFTVKRKELWLCSLKDTGCRFDCGQWQLADGLRTNDLVLLHTTATIRIGAL